MSSDLGGDAKASVPSPSGWSRTSKSLPRAEERSGCKVRSSENSPILVIDGRSTISPIARRHFKRLGRCEFIIGKSWRREHSSFVLQNETLVTILKRKETEIAEILLIEVWEADWIFYRTGRADLRNQIRNLLI